VPFPSSFESVVVIENRQHDLDATMVGVFLERAFATDGASVLNSEGTYFEFRRPYFRNFVPSLVRGGTISIDSTSNTIEVKSEVFVRLTPGLLVLLGFTALPSVIGGRPMESILSLLVSGGVMQFFYVEAVVGFSKYVHALCRSARRSLIAS
jgi:hypothetical protein